MASISIRKRTFKSKPQSFPVFLPPGVWKVRAATPVEPSNHLNCHSISPNVINPPQAVMSKQTAPRDPSAQRGLPVPGMQHGGLWAKFRSVTIRGRVLFKHPPGDGADIQPAEVLPQMRASMTQGQHTQLSSGFCQHPRDDKVSLTTPLLSELPTPKFPSKQHRDLSIQRED